MTSRWMGCLLREHLMMKRWVIEDDFIMRKSEFICVVSWLQIKNFCLEPITVWKLPDYFRRFRSVDLHRAAAIFVGFPLCTS